MSSSSWAVMILNKLIYIIWISSYSHLSLDPICRNVYCCGSVLPHATACTQLADQICFTFHPYPSAPSAPAAPPRPPNLTSVPTLLFALQNEWDSVVLETFNLRQQNAQLRQELSHALYKEDAAMRVLARVQKERDEARECVVSSHLLFYLNAY